MNEGPFLIAIFLLLTALIAFFLMRLISVLRRERDKTTTQDESRVGFIVGTFHELVAKLKEKEKELEALRKEAEQRADVIESYNEYILQSVPSGVISLDRDFIITKVNSSAERILDIRADEVIGNSYSDFFREPLKGILDGTALMERGEIQYSTLSGREVHIGLTITPLLDASKNPIGKLMVFTDLTELKALEAQAALRDRLSSLGEMAAGMAHELRNPMAVIAGYTKMLSKKVDPSLLHVVDSVSMEIAVMDRVITDFLSFARPTELNLSSVNLNLLLQTCISNSVGDRKDIRVHLAKQEIPRLQGDEILLRQALTNLIRNAVEAMPHGGDLSLGVTTDAYSVEISISDSGRGIPEKTKDRIFIPFYTTKDSGTGLGLAIVHKVVVSHRGSITVESNDKGTTFRVRLPLQAARNR